MQAITQQKMTIEQWIGVTDCSIQRDTVAHAKKARNKHLKVSSITHARVAAARLPNGKLVKLDGHTRAALWNDGSLERPDCGLFVDVYKCQTNADVERLYKEFDNTSATETAGDKLYGAYRGHGFTPVSRLIIGGSVSTALKLCLSSSDDIPIYDRVTPFIGALRIIDQAMLNNRPFPAGVLSALIITVMRDGDDALEFWRAYSNNEGCKQSGKRDAVQALTEIVLERRSKANLSCARTLIRDLAGKSVSAYQAFQKGRWYSGGVKSTDFRAYADAALEELQF